jgi:hypothetical protein
MKPLLLLLAGLTLCSPVSAYTLDENGDPSPRIPPTYQINTYDLGPGYQQQTILRNNIPVKICYTYRFSGGYSTTNCGN